MHWLRPSRPGSRGTHRRFIGWSLVVLLLTGLIGATPHQSAAAGYVRPFGPNAPWNIPVAALPRHPASTSYANLLYNDAPDRPGNFNLSFDDYTYPVYEVTSGLPQYTVQLSTNWGNMDGHTMPWDPSWQPAPGTDAQVIVIDPASGYEWDLFKVSVNTATQTISATNANLIQRGLDAGTGSDPASYFTKENGFRPSRGIGIQYLAMLVRPEEITQGSIPHALSMPIRNTDGTTYVAPATKLEHNTGIPGIPEGTRFALQVTDAEIEQWISTLPSGLSLSARNAARTIAHALRDYGWFITDTAGSAPFQFEARVSAGSEWDALGLGTQTLGGKEYPRDLLDGLITSDRIYTLVPSDQYPPYWRFDGNANDASTYGYNGTLLGGAGFSSGRVGQALNLDGIDDYVSVPHQDAFTQAPFTVVGWVQFDQLSSTRGASQYLFRMRHNDVPWHAWRIELEATTNKLMAQVINAGQQAFTLSSSSAVTTGTWYHVALSVDANDQATFYVNGQPQGSVNTGSLFFANSDLRIGTNNPTGNNLDGRMDEVRLYRSALSQSQIQAIMQAESP